MYQDETGYEKGKVQNEEDCWNSDISLDEKITIISEITAIMGKKEQGVRDK